MTEQEARMWQKVKLWRKFSAYEAIESKSPEMESAEREFGGFISTDGISVHVKMKAATMKPNRGHQMTHKRDAIDNVNDRTLSLLRRVQMEDMTNKVVIVVDGGKSPIMTAGYYQTNPTLDATGKLGYTPFYLSAGQVEAFKAQRPTHQRGSTSWRNARQKLERKAQKKEKQKTRSEKRRLDNDHTQKRTNTQRSRRVYGHFFQVSTRYWREISGQRHRKLKETKWMKDATIMNFQKSSCNFSRNTGSFASFKSFVEFTLLHVKAQLAFYGRKRWRRLRLDSYMRRKRASGEISRRFFPKGISKDDIVVIWGDGDYKHNMPGTVTTPKDMFSNFIRRSRPALFLPGCEYLSSQKCPECHGSVQQAKMKKRNLYKVLQCKSVKHCTGKTKHFER